MARKQSAINWNTDPTHPFAVSNAKLTSACIRLVLLFRGLGNDLYRDATLEFVTFALIACPAELRATVEQRVRREALQSTAPLAEPDETEYPTRPAPRRHSASRTMASPLSATKGAVGAKGKDFDRSCIEWLQSPSGQCWLTDEIGNTSAKSLPLLRAAMEKIDAFVAASGAALSPNSLLVQNLLGLSEAEVRLVDLAEASAQCSPGDRMFGAIEGHARIRRALAVLCGLPPHGPDITGRGSKLADSGFFENLGQEFNDLDNLLQLSDIGTRLLLRPHENLASMANSVLRPMRAGTGTHFWDHLVAARTTIASLLRNVNALRVKGINILIHGAPGTGKTEFVASLAQDIGCAAFAVESVNPQGLEAHRQDRLASLALCQRLAGAEQNCVLVLDEAEDIFQVEYGNPFASRASSRYESKAWMNNLLESNPHPVIWISNRVQHLDPAYLRRFAYVLEFRTPPLQHRLALTRHYLDDLGVSTPFMEKLARHPALTPAMLASARQFTELTTTENPVNLEAREDALNHHIEVQLKTLGLRRIGTIPEANTRFDARYLNIQGRASATQVLQAFVRQQRGTAIFAGAPGTGKTQFAQHIADHCGRELLFRTAADINSMWFGESERNVAALFEDCDVQSQMIFLDEGDTLLMARSAAVNHPERAVTAEFLRRLEAFKGIFISATNHRESLDPALMRRFVFRLDFLPLVAKQRSLLFAETIWGCPGEMEAAEKLQALDPELARRLNRLDRLTPGDFANVRRRLQALGESDNAAQWVEELEAESAVKPTRESQGIGFVTTL